jgi:hypothetical protein
MKVIIITNHYLNNNGGGSFASRAYINAFAELSSKCILIYPDNGIDIKNYISSKCIIYGISYNKPKIKKLIDIYTV